MIPEQSAGNSNDHVAEISFDSPEQAVNCYLRSRLRLLNVSGWKEYAGFMSASFELTDPNGMSKSGAPKPGDHFRIALPSPAPGDHYDWVRVEMVEEQSRDDEDFTIIRVRPATDPTGGDSDTQHFFSDLATSSFIIRRKANKVSAEVHGRNEQANIEHAGSTTTALRNMVVAAGALMGFSDMQWDKLVKGLLQGT